ncbi:MAG TPA: hypothetical protein VLH79_02025 [Chthonomonadales bacterium]|nr:hypothetical protein [Chthonomonadales bacterium]
MTPTIVCLVTSGVVAIVAVTAALRPIPLPIATGKFAWANMSGEAGQELGPDRCAALTEEEKTPKHRSSLPCVDRAGAAPTALRLAGRRRERAGVRAYSNVMSDSAS